ncbi:hypothetical protein [Peribacillus alkalitolerans]|uniref:YphA family membrane protein n=1 Tax=Peribacillus alkalitolerans TaxID=1550385 RepID=UPI0013D33C00|nr:hypothetical protein [Peribacillus alkalitolerans]
MEGIFFIWLAWIIFVILTFFYNSSSNRNRNIFHVLVLIILSPYEFPIPVSSIHVSLAALYLIIILFLHTRTFNLKQISHLFISSLIIGLCIASFGIFAMIDPVWILFDPTWMLTIILLYLSIILVYQWKLRIVSLLLGMIVGEMLMFMAVYRLGLPYHPFSNSWMDQVAKVGAGNMIWRLFEISATAITQTRFAAKKEV